MSQDNSDSELVEEPVPETTSSEEEAESESSDVEFTPSAPLLKNEANTDSKATKPIRPPPPSLRLRRLAPLAPDRSRLYALGAVGVFVAIGVGLIIASPSQKKSVLTPPPLALTSGALDAGTAAVAVVDRKESVDAGPVVRPPPVWRVAAMKEEAGVDLVEGSFGKKGLVATLTTAGLLRAEIKRINKAFENIKHIDHPSANDKFVLAKDKKGSVLAFEYVSSPFDVWQARVDPDDAAKAKDAGAKTPLPDLDAKKLEFFIEHKRVASALVIGADLAKTIAAANLRPELVDEIDDALEGHVEDGALKTGSRMRIVSTQDTVDGNVVRTKLEAVEVVPRGGSSVRIYFYERGSDVEGSSKQKPVAGFYDGKGRQPFHGQFRPPLQLSRITSRYNPNRMHPVLHVVMPHNGVDYAGSPGTPIYASAAGTVITAGDSGPCGNMVSIDHGGGLTTAYCHMSRIAPGIHAGLKVESRQNIGFVGMTGRVTGPHLHFVVKRNGSFIDPLSIKMDGVRVLPPADRDAFLKKRGDLDLAIDGTALPAAPVGKDELDVEEDKDLHE